MTEFDTDSASIGRADIAVVGASGAVGGEMLRLLEARGVAPERLCLFGSERSRGTTIRFAGQDLKSRVLERSAIEAGFRLALFAADNDVATEWAPYFVAAGTVVVDNSSAFRMDPAVPLVVPEINGDRLRTRVSLVANPNCSTILLLLAIAPLRALGEFRCEVSTYQAVSGAGYRGTEALRRETAGETFVPGDPFSFPIAGNLFPLIGPIGSDGLSGEETKMVEESRKILSQDDFDLLVTCVRVPVERCHSESISCHFASAVDRERAAQLLTEAPGVQFFPDPEQPPTPLPLSCRQLVGVGRLRQPRPHVLQLWVVGDQLLKGAALNAIQIAEFLGFVPSPGAPAL